MLLIFTYKIKKWVLAGQTKKDAIEKQEKEIEAKIKQKNNNCTKDRLLGDFLVE